MYVWYDISNALASSLITAGGGAVVADDCWRVVREKPCKAAGLISAIIIGNGEDLHSHDINDMIEDNALPERKETCSSESTSSATLQEGYLTQEAKNGGWYACDENLLDEMELEIRENELKGDTKSQLLSTVEEEQQSVVVIDAGKESSLSEVHDDCGLLEMIDLKQLVSSKDWQ
ncbi:hypothetical protein TELCIR_10748 [Teladorsagia circumcincta]|uniref:Uncharacterized protein n=1 Tax=Teladorsagia circumcincta TaxID=45464 RepID=A0A2G9UCN1_TELCI|nr:hypothetical protein TELCIR_10748 [Teladorsagia circumcincta]